MTDRRTELEGLMQSFQALKKAIGDLEEEKGVQHDKICVLVKDLGKEVEGRKEFVAGGLLARLVFKSQVRFKANASDVARDKPWWDRVRTWTVEKEDAELALSKEVFDEIDNYILTESRDVLDEEALKALYEEGEITDEEFKELLEEKITEALYVARDQRDTRNNE